MDDFSQLVRQYIDLVYAAARRQVRDAEMAEDVTQAVFIILQQKFKSIPAGHPLSAWLLKTTSYCAANARRAKDTRDYHERRAGAMAQIEREGDSSEASWEQLSPLLDEGLNKLRAKDRDALLLRFFEKKSVREVGAALGISEEAAGKRLARAVERLRDFFQRRGATVSAVGLAALLAAESTQAAPVALAGTVTAAGATAATTAAATTSTAGAVAKGALVMMAAEKMKLAAIGVGVLILGVGGGAVVVNSMSSGNTVKVPVKPAVAVEQPVTLAQYNWTIQFEGGATATILGINEGTAIPGNWWFPDGSAAPDPNVDMPLNPEIPAGKRALQLIVMFDGVGERAVMAELAPATPTSMSTSVARGKVRSMRWAGGVDSDLTTADLVIGVRRPKSENEVQFAPASAGQPAALGEPQLKAIREETGEAIVDMVFPPSVLVSGQIVAVVDGKELLPRNVTGGMLTRSYRFGAPRAKIETIIYREGQMETVRLKNVSLRPGERTNVSGMPATLTFPVQFSDGSIVEILGITDPKVPGKWWTANGLPSTMPALPEGGMSRAFPAGNQPQRKVVVRMTGNVADKSLALRFDGSGGGATFSTTDGKTLMLEHVSTLPKPLKTTTLGLYKSSGPYRVDETLAVGADAATQPNGRIRSVTEEAGKVKVKLRVPSPPSRRDEHVAVVLKDGREVRASQMSSGSAEPQFTWHAFDCKLDQVVRVVIKSREMESADMKNISLDPTEPPTAILVHRTLLPTEKAP